MKNLKSTWIAGLSMALLMGLAGCNVLGSASAPENSLPQDICSGPGHLAFDLEAASQAPLLPEIDPNTTPVLGLLGSEGAQGLAQGMAPRDTFCSLAVSDGAAEAIAQAMRLVDRGKNDQARNVLAEWLAGIGSLTPNKLAAPVQSGETSRQQIRDLLNAAAADQAAGGDGSTFTSQANQTFRDLFAGEIGDAGFGDSLRLAEEAGLLGEEELSETAKNRANKIWEENLKADLEDFDPCQATKEDVRDLLNTLAQAMLLGIQGSYEGDGEYYQVVKAKVQAAAQQLTNQLATNKNFPELTSPVPECTPGGDIEVRQLLAFAKEPCIDAIPFTLAWQGTIAQLEGSGSTNCTHVEENLGGSPAAIHQITHLNLSFEGTAMSGYPGTLKVTLTTSGEIIEFYSNMPEDAIELFTEANPFRVPADATFELNFGFWEGAQAEILNPETGEAAFIFILHLEQP